MPDADVGIRLTTRGGPAAKQELDGVAGAARHLGTEVERAGSASKRLDQLSDRAGRVGRSMSTFVTLPIAGALAGAVNAASDLHESMSKTDVVFGDAATEIHQFASTAATDIGQSRRQAEEATNTFGNLFTAMKIGREPAAQMSLRLVKLASDLASFNNSDPTDAMQALRSGLVGEIEPLRRFGVNLNDATIRTKALELGLLHATNDALSPAVRAQAAYALILEQTTTAQGDFARTADGVANRTRIMKAQLADTAAELGTSLLPTAQRLIGTVTGLAKGFSELPPPLQDAAVQGALLLAAIGPMSSVAAGGAKAISGLGKAVQFLATTNSLAAVSASSLGLALGGLAVGYIAVSQTLNALEAANRGIIDSQVAATNAVALGAETTKQQAVDAYTNAIEATGGAAEANRTYAASFGPIQQAARRTLGELSESTGVTRERIVQLANSLGINLGSMSDEAREKLAGAIAAISTGVTPTARLAAVTGTLGNEFATTKEQADAYAEALDATLGSLLGAQRSAIDYRAAVSGLDQALQSSNGADAQAERTANLERASISLQQAQEREASAQEKLDDIRRRSAAEDIARAERQATRATHDQTEAQEALGEAETHLARLRAAGRSPKALEAAEDAVAEARLQVGDATDRATDAQKALEDARSGATRTKELHAAELDLRDAHLAVTDAQHQVTTAQDENARSASALVDEQDRVRRALLDTVTAAEADIEAMATSGRITNDAATKKSLLLQRLDELKARFPELAPAIDTYKASLGAIPGEVQTKVTVLTEEAVARLNVLNTLFNNLGDKASPAAARIIDQILSGRAGMAQGGIAPDGAYAVIAERGTGGEVAVPRLGISRSRAVGLLDVAAGWYGAKVVSLSAGGVLGPPGASLVRGGDGGSMGGVQIVRVVERHETHAGDEVHFHGSDRELVREYENVQRRKQVSRSFSDASSNDWTR